MQPVASAVSMHAAALSSAVQSYLKQNGHWQPALWQLSQPPGYLLHSWLSHSAEPRGWVWTVLGVLLYT